MGRILLGVGILYVCVYVCMSLSWYVYRMENIRLLITDSQAKTTLLMLYKLHFEHLCRLTTVCRFAYFLFFLAVNRIIVIVILDVVDACCGFMYPIILL